MTEDGCLYSFFFANLEVQGKAEEILSGKVNNDASTLQPFVTDNILEQGNEHISCCKNSISLILVFLMHQPPDHQTLLGFFQLSSVDVAISYVDANREYGAEIKHTVL